MHRQAGLDALLAPTFGLPALPHGASRKLLVACSYSFLWNNFNCPAGTVPVTTVRDDEQTYPTSSDGGDALDALATEAMAGSAGLPVGVQVAAEPWRDELVLRVMKEIEQGVKFSAEPRWSSSENGL